jgi:hypothetical protein
MALKTYSLRLDEDEYEKLRKALSDYGDPDLNVGFVLRTYISDLNKAIPHLKKSDIGIRNNLAFWGSALRNINLIAKIENIMKGEPIVERIKEEAKESERKK